VQQPTAVTVAEIVGLQNLDEGYLNGFGVPIFRPVLKRALESDGHRKR